MSDQKSSPKKKSIEWEKARWFILGAFVLFIAWPFITWGSLGIADWLFEGINFLETSRFGIRDDMYGGINTLFSGIAFICFIYALRQQRLELQLQRRELSLQRRELKAQCREQERQANEFELQNKLMKNQQFESFFYQQIVFIKSIYTENRALLKEPNKNIDFINDVISFINDIENYIIDVLKDTNRSDQWTVQNENKLDEKCPECGSDLVIKKGKYGKFIACSNYPECKYIKKDEKKQPKMTDKKCPNCGKNLLIRKGKFGDLMVKVKVEIPRNLTDKQKTILREMWKKE